MARYGVVSAKEHNVLPRRVAVVTGIAFAARLVLPTPGTLRSLHEEERGSGGVVARYGGEVDFSGDWDSPVGAEGGEVDGKLVRGDSDLLTEKGDELFEIERRINGDLADGGLRVAVEVDDGDGRASAVIHVAPMST